jgi:hypothetical protein
LTADLELLLCDHRGEALEVGDDHLVVRRPLVRARGDALELLAELVEQLLRFEIERFQIDHGRLRVRRAHERSA